MITNIINFLANSFEKWLKVLVLLLSLAIFYLFVNAFNLERKSKTHCATECHTKDKHVAHDVSISEYAFCTCEKDGEYELFKMKYKDWK